MPNSLRDHEDQDDMIVSLQQAPHEVILTNNYRQWHVKYGQNKKIRNLVQTVTHLLWRRHDGRPLPSGFVPRGQKKSGILFKLLRTSFLEHHFEYSRK